MPIVNTQISLISPCIMSSDSSQFDLESSLSVTNTKKEKIPNDQLPKFINSAIFATYTADKKAIEDVCFYIENNLSDIIQLPELFFVNDKSNTTQAESREVIEKLSLLAIEEISQKLRPFQYVCTSLIINNQHQAVLINQQGIAASQPQLTYCNRYKWTSLSNELKTIHLPLEQGAINIALLTADDFLKPNILNMLALNGVQTLLVPFDIQSHDDVENNLLKYANENRISIVAATREKNFNFSNSNSSKKSTGFIINLPTELTKKGLLNSRTYSGDVNQPLIKHQHGKITKALITPSTIV